MSLNGELNIQLNLAKQGEQLYLNKIDIDLARPNLAQKMLVGQTPEQAIERITQLMTVCQHAQTAAAKLALGYQLTNEEIITIEYENIEQGFWRLVIDLPKLLDIELPLSVFIKLRQAIAQQYKTTVIILAEQLFQQLCQLSANEFANLSNSELQHWLHQNNSPMASCLRKTSQLMPAVVDKKSTLLAALPEDALLATLGKLLQSDQCFHQKPHLNMHSCETGSLSIMQGHHLFSLLSTQGTVGRFVSRLLYIAQKINELSSKESSSRDSSNKPSRIPKEKPQTVESKNVQSKKSITGSFSLEQNEDTGVRGFSLGWVQTARGLLVHLANIQEGKISQYSIVAPTEWNFHPEGALSKTLIHSPFSSAELAEKTVKLAILALDPCIEFNLGAAYA